MDLSGEQLIPAPRDAVWRALNDPEILKQCIPGCDELHAIGENGYEAAVTARIGPMRARFKCKVALSDIDPPNGYTISGEAQGGVAGFGKGAAKVMLSDEDGGTRLRYAATAQIGGKLAQLGARMIEPVAAKMADEFFGGFNRILAPQADVSAVQDLSASSQSDKPVDAKSVLRMPGLLIGLALLAAVSIIWFAIS